MPDNLKIFSNFFNSNYHLIVRGTNNWPSERIIFQLGYEHSENSIITHHAEDFLKNKRVKWPWLKQINRAKGNQISPNYSTIQKFDFGWESYFLLDEETLVGLSYWSLCICDVKTGVCKPFNEKDILENNSTAYYDEKGNAVPFSGGLKINKFQFLSWHNNGSICLWNIEKKSKIIFKENSAPITSVKLINDAQFISCSENDIRIWNIKTQVCEVLQGHNDKIYDLIIIDCDRFISYSKDTTFRIWNIHNNNSILFDQIKIYCDDISSTKEFQEQLKEENKRALEFTSKYNPTYKFKPREKKDQDGIQSLLWLGNERIILSSGFGDFYLFDIKAKSFKPIFGSTLLEWYLSLSTKKYDLEDRIFDLEIGDIPSLPSPPASSIEEDEFFSSNDTAQGDYSEKEISNLRLELEVIENDIEDWRFLSLNVPKNPWDILLIKSNVLGVVSRDEGSQKAKFIIIDIESNHILKSVELDLFDLNDKVKYLGDDIILIIHKSKYFFTIMNLKTGVSTVMDQHTDKVGDSINDDGVRILTDTNFITSCKSELRFWDISQFAILANASSKIKVKIISDIYRANIDNSNILLLNHHVLVFWAYDYQNNITIYDFSNNRLIKEIEINKEILLLKTIIFSYTLSENDVIMIQEDIYGGKLYHINLLTSKINILSDNDEVIINCIKDEYLHNHFITWSNQGVIKIWDMNKQTCIRHYVFDGVHYVSQISRNQFLAISRNGKHIILKLNTFSVTTPADTKPKIYLDPKTEVVTCSNLTEYYNKRDQKLNKIIELNDALRMNLNEEIKMNIPSKIIVNHEINLHNNILLLSNEILIFWDYNHKNNIAVYDFLNSSLIKEIEINENIVSLFCVLSSFALSETEIIMIEDHIHGGKLYHINLQNGEINVLSDNGEVIVNCIKDKYLKNHFITWTNDGVVKIWDMNKLECIIRYVFEGVCEVFQINKKNLIAISKNGKHRVLSLENL